MKNEFTIITLTRETLEDCGLDASKLNDETMESIAHDMGKAYFEYGDYFLNMQEAYNKYAPNDSDDDMEN